ncbi:MAG TPA: radical SAM protein, partial [Nitrospiria bacterium]|nr:radical SAM protein [Nitrospiria bacterium]
MEDWQKELQDSLIRPEDLARELGVKTEGLEAVMKEYRVRITPQVLKQIKNGSEAVRRQVVPDVIEGEDILAPPDPLNEDSDSPAPHLVHRYPDRVLLMVTNQCPIYCRFCTRKRLVGKPGFLSKGDLEEAVGYIRRHPEIRDVILSGGDPLLLTDKHLETVLKSLRAVPHLEIIRIGTRV